jgi:hypothetical protein
MERVEKPHWTEPLWKELHTISEDHDKLEQSLCPILFRHTLVEKSKHSKKNTTIDLSALEDFQMESFIGIDLFDRRFEKGKIDVSVQSPQLPFIKKDQRNDSSSKKLEDLAKPKRSTTTIRSALVTRTKAQKNNAGTKRSTTTKSSSRTIDNVPDKSMKASSKAEKKITLSDCLTSDNTNTENTFQSIKSNEVLETCSYGWSDYSEVPTMTCDSEFDEFVSCASVSTISEINFGHRLEVYETKRSHEAYANVHNVQTGEAMPNDIMINTSVNAADFEYPSPSKHKMVEKPCQVSGERQKHYSKELKEYLPLPSPAVRSNCASAIEKENEQCLETLSRTERLISKKENGFVIN